MNLLTKTAIACSSILLCVNAVGASELDVAKESFTTTYQNLLLKYEQNIKALQDENAKLRAENTKLRDGFTGKVLESTPTSSISGSTIKPVITTPVATGSIKYNTTNAAYMAVMQKVYAQSGALYKENGLSGNLTIGLFEFVAPNAVFISVDDGLNGTGVTAFKYKMVYTYDSNYALSRAGSFVYQSTSGKYLTTFGKNNYANSIRTKILDPHYKGKLLENTSSSTVSNTTSTNTSKTTVTITEIKSAYTSGNTAEVIKLSATFLATNPNNIEVRTLRYRSFFMINQYDNALAEVQKIESIQGSSFSAKTACDGKKIAKYTTKTDLYNHYNTLCK